MIKIVYLSSCEVPVILLRFDRFSKNTQISDFMKIGPLGAEFCAGGQTDEVNSCFLQFCERA